MKTEQNAIVKNIRHVYKKRLFSPIIYLLLLGAFWLTTPLSQLVFPARMSEKQPPQELIAKKQSYVTTTLFDLHFTGYTQEIFGHTNGYYYYTFRDGKCTLVLLSPHTCEEGLPNIKKLTVNVRLLDGFENYGALTQQLANDLGWTDTGVHSAVSDCLLSEPDFNRVTTTLLLGFFAASACYALAEIFICAAYILFPLLAPTCRALGRYGNAAKLLAQAQDELATLPQLATEDMYITEHYFIAFASDRVAVVPISEIIWIYKHSTLHKFLWYHFSISYTLHITANRHLYLQFPKNMKSDIDGIIDYLSEANHAIFVGFNEKNRLEVQKLLGVSAFVTRLTGFLNKKL